MSSKIKKLHSGEKFGKYTVISHAGKDKNSQSLSLVICDCGSKRTVLNQNLKSGKSKSCGCGRYGVGIYKNRKHKQHKSIKSGTVFGNLTYLCTAGYFEDRRCNKAHVRCTCGNFQIAIESELLKGSKTGCGCRKGQSLKKYYMEYRSQKGLPFDVAITPETKLQRSKFTELSKLCIQRDDYTCQLCNLKGTDLNAHHIYPWANYPELRFDLNNVITLCKRCHFEKAHDCNFHSGLNLDIQKILKRKLIPTSILTE